MKALKRKDSMHLEAAEGWLLLGDHIAANEELEKITADRRAHPSVLEMRCKIYAAAEKWDRVLLVAETLTDQLPNHPTGWLLLADAEHHLGDTEGAYETLAAIAEEFAEEHPEVTYALAVYATLAGEFMEAEDWLARSLDVGGTKLKLKALDDPNLNEFWKRIGRIWPEH